MLDTIIKNLTERGTVTLINIYKERVGLSFNGLDFYGFAEKSGKICRTPKFSLNKVNIRLVLRKLKVAPK